MEEIRLFIDWLMTSFKQLYVFFSQQHPIVQACVFMPLEVIVIKLFIYFFKSLFQGRSLG